MIFKTGRKALTVAIIASATSFTSGYVKDALWKGQPAPANLEKDYLISSVVLNSLPVIADVVGQLKLANTEVGRFALSTGLVADVNGIFFFMTRVFERAHSVDLAINTLLPLLIFLLTLVFLFCPIVYQIIRNTPEGKPLSMSLIYVLVAIAVANQMLFTVLKLNTVMAPFLIGLVLPAGAPLGTALVEKFGSFTSGVLIHILIPVALMKADLYALFMIDLSQIGKTILLVFQPVLTKMAGFMIPYLMFKMPINEAAAIAFIMSYTGVVNLYTASINIDNGTFRDETYSFAIFSVLLNSTIFPIIIKKLYNPSTKYDGNNTRNVLSLKPHSELRILTCIYGQDNAESSIKLLDTLHPTKENPIDIYALHLVELLGRYVPLLVSHSKLKSITTNTSQKMIYDFNQYEKLNWDSISLHLFTSLSSFPLMHEDIINIALEKKTSLIILPLHRRWSVHGDIESQEIGWRSVNCSVLEKAPCSVAIFFSRGSSLIRQRSRLSLASSLSVCMIFFGGNDDHEALILAKWMLKASEVTLTVVQFLPKDDHEEIDDREIDESQDQMYDVVMLDDIRKMATVNERLVYRSHVVEDGPETISRVRSIANEFDMFIVGRRYGVSISQTSGLSQWSGLPELGVIGDLFASKDLATRASVLVVQKQKKFS